MTSKDSDVRSQRLDQIIAECLKAIESGGAPDREERFAQNLELDGDLNSLFPDHDQMQAAREGVEALHVNADRNVSFARILEWQVRVAGAKW